MGTFLAAAWFGMIFRGSVSFVWRDDTAIFLLTLATMWFAITLMAFDEIYSAIRYMMVSRKFKRDIAVVLSEDN